MTGGNGWIWPLSAWDLIAAQQRLGPARPGSDEGGAAGEHGGMALPRHDAVNERMCRRATVAYGLLMLQKQYSSMSPEARKCSLSTMWL
jgi:hypothetical protein